MGMDLYGEQLLQAMKDTNMRVARVLVTKLSDVNFQCLSRHSALHSAVLYGEVEVAALLLARGADMMLMPRNKTYENKHECPLMMALKMGESRAEMQQLLIDNVYRQLAGGQKTRSTRTYSKENLEKLGTVPHYAMLYSTPAVFSCAIACHSDANARNIDNMTPFMHTIREVANFEKDVDICRFRMRQVMHQVDQYPEMLWARYNRVDVHRTRPFFSEKVTSTGLGMVVFECITARCERISVEVGECNRQFLNPTMLDSAILLQKRIQCDYEVVQFFKKEFIPQVFSRMMEPMYLALCMATHCRLGKDPRCAISVLHSDTMHTIFLVLLHTLTTAEMEHMLC